VGQTLPHPNCDVAARGLDCCCNSDPCRLHGEKTDGARDDVVSAAMPGNVLIGD